MKEIFPLLDGYKLGQVSSAIDSGNSDVSIFPNPGPNPSYYSDSQFSKYQMETFRGQPLDGNDCISEAYAHITTKDGFYFISYYFFYPYNGGMGPSDWDSKPLDNESGYCAHVGDWETITATIKINSNKISLINVVYEAHGERVKIGSDDCVFNDPPSHSFNDRTLDEITPIQVYSCWHSHSSRTAPGKYCTNNLLASDYADNGPIWYTGSNLVFITNESPSWVRYNGRWGANIEYANIITAFSKGALRLGEGPQGPAFHKTWIEGDEVNINLKNKDGVFSPVYTAGKGIAGFDLHKPADRVFAFDYDGSGKLDHLVMYRPGTGAICIAKNKDGVFFPVYRTGGRGIGGFDLKNPADRIFAFDYNGSGKLDHLVVYRPGTGIYLY
jgi:hypothetical protein